MEREITPGLSQDILQEALRHLQNLIRLNTSNPPGNEVLATDYLAPLLAKENIPYQILEAAPGRSNLVARISSFEKNNEGALLLSAHLDVVPAEAEKWKYPPFEARIEEGFVWGRGAIDMKHMVVYSLMTLLLVKRLGLKLKRDLIFAAVADEEAGCDQGSRFLVEQHPELIRAEYALNELGGFTLHTPKKRYYPIQVAEKGFVWLKIKAKGEAGHGSLPHDQNPIVKLARIIERLHHKFLPRHLHPVAEGFILSLASGYGFPASLLLKGTTNNAIGDLLLKIIPDPNVVTFFKSILHNTACPTGLEGGQKINVIPSEAAVLIDGRILPGTTPENFLQELHEALRSFSPDYEIEVLKKTSGTESPTDTPLFRTLKQVIEERDAGSEAIPYLIAGFTDATNYQKLGIKTYGFSPIKLPPDIIFSKLYHNHDERIPVDGFFWGLETFFEAVTRYCC